MKLIWGRLESLRERFIDPKPVTYENDPSRVRSQEGSLGVGRLNLAPEMDENIYENNMMKI